MKLFSSLLLLGALSLVASLPSPDAAAEAIAILEPAPGIKFERDVEGVMLLKRVCKYNGCACKKGTPQGQYCRACAAITKVGDTSVYDSPVNGWVFECNPGGGCCAYGPRKSCAGGKKNPCGPSTSSWDIEYGVDQEGGVDRK